MKQFELENLYKSLRKVVFWVLSGLLATHKLKSVALKNRPTPAENDSAARAQVHFIRIEAIIRK
jgi:hypothetical protein